MDDLISRQAAIDAFANVAFMHIEADKLGVHESMDGNWFNADEAVEALKQLPSVQLATDTNVGIKLGTNLAEVGTDCISKKQVIDALEKWLHGLFGITEADGTATIFKTIRQLPPIQPKLLQPWEVLVAQAVLPQPEIVRCKNCKHWIPYDWMFSEVWQSKNIADYPEDEIGCNLCDMAMKANDFCSRAERREVTE